ncbi:uncharacterized protein V1510DRAFT_449630 [Dipodascopsis tothii]|uniref:uncharacterized protein n=1 Tax=Dipodascopsis tothii TaxID=44089 RepID=UPI0034CE4DBB
MASATSAEAAVGAASAGGAAAREPRPADAAAEPAAPAPSGAKKKKKKRKGGGGGEGLGGGLQSTFTFSFDNGQLIPDHEYLQSIVMHADEGAYGAAGGLPLPAGASDLLGAAGVAGDLSEDERAYAEAALTGAPKKKNKKKKKKTAAAADAAEREPEPKPLASQKPADRIWNTNTSEERERIKDFWLSLGEDERRSLVKVEKEAVLRKMKEQQKHSCSCSVCGRKRNAIEEELEVLYDAYYEELEQYANQQQKYGGVPPPVLQPPYRALSAHAHHAPLPPAARLRELPEDEEELEEDDDEDDFSESDQPPDMVGHDIPREFFNFGNSLTVQGGILTVADDLLKNDGKKFIEMMEQLAERRMAREEALAAPDDYDDEEYDDEDDDDDYDDEDDDEVDSMSEEQRMEEGRRMFQIFAARMFEQRVLTAYREKVSQERQRKLLEELDEENRIKEERELKKLKEKEKKKDKKRLQKLAKEEEKQRKEAERAAEEAALRKEEERKAEEARRKREELRLRKEAERRQQEEERLRKEEERKRRVQEERERDAERERKRKEKEEAERRRREQTAAKERERAQKDKEERERRQQEERERRQRQVDEERNRTERERHEKEIREVAERLRKEHDAKRLLQQQKHEQLLQQQKHDGHQSHAHERSHHAAASPYGTPAAHNSANHTAQQARSAAPAPPAAAPAPPPAPPAPPAHAPQLSQPFPRPFQQSSGGSFPSPRQTPSSQPSHPHPHPHPLLHSPNPSAAPGLAKPTSRMPLLAQQQPGHAAAPSSPQSQLSAAVGALALDGPKPASPSPVGSPRPAGHLPAQRPFGLDYPGLASPAASSPMLPTSSSLLTAHHSVAPPPPPGISLGMYNSGALSGTGVYRGFAQGAASAAPAAPGLAPAAGGLPIGGSNRSSFIMSDFQNSPASTHSQLSSASPITAGFGMLPLARPASGLANGAIDAAGPPGIGPDARAAAGAPGAPAAASPVPFSGPDLGVSAVGAAPASPKSKPIARPQPIQRPTPGGSLLFEAREPVMGSRALYKEDDELDDVSFRPPPAKAGMFPAAGPRSSLFGQSSFFPDVGSMSPRPGLATLGARGLDASPADSTWNYSIGIPSAVSSPPTSTPWLSGWGAAPNAGKKF